MKQKIEVLCVDSTDYLIGGSLLLNNGKVDKYLFSGGYCQNTDSTLAFNYFNQDHLGNNREVVDSNGKVVQINNYYPFGTPFYDEANTTNASLQPFKYNGKELDMMHGLNTYDYGARQYYSAVPNWDRIDPLCEKYYSISPYAYCANNPVNRIDPDGREIWIYYMQDGNQNSIMYSVGMSCDIQDKNVQAIINNLNAIASNPDGRDVINSIVDSDTKYAYTQINTISENAEGYFDSNSNIVGLQDVNNTMAFAEETFHLYQYVNGEGGPTAVNEVEAKLFSSKMNYEIQDWQKTGYYLLNLSGLANSSFADNMTSLFWYGFDNTTFSNAVNSFFDAKLSGPIYKKKGYTLGNLKKESLIKKFLPVK